MTQVPFTFAVAVMARTTARAWSVVEALLGLTLRSVLGQTDQEFRVLLAGHDRPGCLPRDQRIEFHEVDWRVEAPGPHNDDGGRKKHLLNDVVLKRGGGYLMWLDADDWVDRRTVEITRAAMGERIGGVITTGLAIDIQTLKAAALPDGRIFGSDFHRVCGSSTIARLRPEDADPLRRDPFTHLRSHHRWIEEAEARGAELARLSLTGGYLINTSENHSDLYGPHVDWRRGFTRAVNRFGAVLDGATLDGFGLNMDHLAGAQPRA